MGFLGMLKSGFVENIVLRKQLIFMTMRFFVALPVAILSTNAKVHPNKDTNVQTATCQMASCHMQGSPKFGSGFKSFPHKPNGIQQLKLLGALLGGGGLNAVVRTMNSCKSGACSASLS